MRILLLLPLSGAIGLAACSRPASRQPGNAVDVEAAASRAQSDIANYAAGTGHGAARTVARPTPLPSATLRRIAPRTP
jgi:outer membrane biogenesis lipoprotein LolB